MMNAVGPMTEPWTTPALMDAREEGCLGLEFGEVGTISQKVCQPVIHGIGNRDASNFLHQRVMAHRVKRLTKIKLDYMQIGAGLE